MEELKYDPSRLVFSMGGNDTGNFDDETRNKLTQRVLLQNIPAHHLTASQKKVLAFDPTSAKARAFELITAQIDEVFGRLKLYFAKARITFVAIWPRNDWLPVSRELANELNEYIEGKHAHKLVYLDWLLKPHHIKRDGVHLTDAGYRLFVDQIFNSVINSYLMPIMRAAKRKRRQVEKMLMDKRRRNTRLKSSVSTGTNTDAHYYYDLYQDVNTNSDHYLSSTTQPEVGIGYEPIYQPANSLDPRHNYTYDGPYQEYKQLSHGNGYGTYETMGWHEQPYNTQYGSQWEQAPGYQGGGYPTWYGQANCPDEHTRNAWYDQSQQYDTNDQNSWWNTNPPPSACQTDQAQTQPNIDNFEPHLPYEHNQPENMTMHTSDCLSTESDYMQHYGEQATFHNCTSEHDQDEHDQQYTMHIPSTTGTPTRDEVDPGYHSQPHNSDMVPHTDTPSYMNTHTENTIISREIWLNDGVNWYGQQVEQYYTSKVGY